MSLLRVAQAEVDAGADARAEGEERRVFAAVIGGGRGGVAAVVGGEDDEVAILEIGFELREPGVEFFEGAGVAFIVIAVAVLLVEIDEVGEDEAAFETSNT